MVRDVTLTTTVLLGRRILSSAALFAIAIGATLAAQAYFLFSADDQVSPAGFFLAANMLMVACMGAAAAASPRCPRRARKALFVAGGAFLLLFAHAVLWTTESWLEDWSAVALWVIAATALAAVVRLPSTPPLIRRTLTFAVVVQGLAIAVDLSDDGVLGVAGASDGGLLEWLNLAGTLVSMAAYQIAFMHIVTDDSLAGAARHALAFIRDGGLARRATGVASDPRYLAWRKDNPDGDYAAFYARRIVKRLDLGLSHKTLGGRVYMSEGLAKDARTFEADEFRTNGRLYFDWFRSRALRRDMTCVDFGCGSLRVGQHLIGYLEPGRYTGLDVVERFYQDGLKLIEPEVIATKRPHFGTICADELARAAALKPDLVYSTAVLQHVPPEELDSYLTKLLGLISDNGVVVTNFRVADAMARTAASNWVHEPSRLFDAVARLDPRAHAVVLAGRSPSISDQATLLIARDPALLAAWARRPAPPMA